MAIGIVSIVSIWYHGQLIFQQLSSYRQRKDSFEITDPTDNIGYKDFSDALRYPPIDAVYTWVNGSDPKWYKEMLEYKTIYNKEHGITEEEKGDSATSANRFRDNDELKF